MPANESGGRQAPATPTTEERLPLFPPSVNETFPSRSATLRAIGAIAGAAPRYWAGLAAEIADKWERAGDPRNADYFHRVASAIREEACVKE